MLTEFYPEKIKNFLTTFASKEADLTRGFADIGLNDDVDDDPPTREKTFKYKLQLVCIARLLTR